MKIIGRKIVVNKNVTKLILINCINILVLSSCSNFNSTSGEGAIIKPLITQSPILTLTPTIEATPTPATNIKITSQPTSTPAKKETTITPTPQKTTPIVTPKPKPSVSPTSTPEILTPIPKEQFSNSKEYTKLVIKTLITEDMDDVERVKAIHDYIVLNTEYDYDNYNSGTIPDISFTVEGVLQEGVAVCQGYAYTFQLFMEALEIDSQIIVGFGLEDDISHAWNMVRLEEEWYHVDTTWDDPVPDQKGMVQYQYFLRSDKIMSIDHGWKKSDYPECDSEDYQYYIYEEDMISSINQYEDKFMEQYNAGERIITILYPEDEMPDFQFLLKYDEIKEYDNGNYVIAYSFNPPWRIGDYTVLTVMMD